MKSIVERYAKENRELAEQYKVRNEKLEKKHVEMKEWQLGILTKMHLHVSCLGCDQIKTETLKMICGHNICRGCILKYSEMEHPKSAIRCEICKIETKVLLMTVSIPNRAMCLLLAEVETYLGHKLNSG